MKKLDKRGVAALEFCLVAVPFFMFMFVIFDLGRYVITQQSLQMLSGAGARQCYINGLATCTGDPLPTDDAKKAVAPFLYSGGLTPSLQVTQGATQLTVTAWLPNFTMLMPIWGALTTGACDPNHLLFPAGNSPTRPCAFTSIPH
jgi:Flp pilus assembly protein TadG